jgi:hypothetical protein
VANLIILHNVNAMTKVIKQLKRAGFDKSPELLAGLSPHEPYQPSWTSISLRSTDALKHRAIGCKIV